MSLGAQNIKTGPSTLGIAENHPRREKMKNGPDALDTAENESGSAKYEN
jgi:hypothetical protein